MQETWIHLLLDSKTSPWGTDTLSRHFQSRGSSLDIHRSDFYAPNSRPTTIFTVSHYCVVVPFVPFVSGLVQYFEKSSFNASRNYHRSAPTYKISAKINYRSSPFLHLFIRFHLHSHVKKANLSRLASSAQSLRKFARDIGSIISAHFFIRISLYLSKLLSVVNPF